MHQRYPLPPLSDEAWERITITQYAQMREADEVMQTIHADTAQPQCGIMDSRSGTPASWIPQPQTTA
jgi:hypothetical protein